MILTHSKSVTQYSKAENGELIRHSDIERTYLEILKRSLKKMPVLRLLPIHEQRMHQIQIFNCTI